MKNWVAHSTADLPFIAKEFLEYIGNNRIVALNAPMGSGKTTFTNAILRAMGVEHSEGSPTFAIIHAYNSPYYGEVYHMDAYRLDDLEEALDIGMEELFYSGAYCFIEWPEKVEALLPENTVEVTIMVNEEGHRVLSAKLP